MNVYVAFGCEPRGNRGSFWSLLRKSLLYRQKELMKLVELVREGVTHAGSRTLTWWLSADFRSMEG